MREWWLRTVLVLSAPRAVFVAIRRDDPESLSLRSEPVLAIVFLAGNTVGSATPTPGGLGGVEAVMAAGLTAIGVPAHQAIPAVLLFRMATFWLPIPAGWISHVVLQRRGVL